MYPASGINAQQIKINNNKSVLNSAFLSAQRRFRMEQTKHGETKRHENIIGEKEEWLMGGGGQSDGRR